VIQRYCVECSTAKIPLLYRVCGTSRPVASSTAAGSRNHRNCVTVNSNEGSNARRLARPFIDQNAHPEAPTKNPASAMRMGQVHRTGQPAESTNGSPEGPV